MKTKKLSADGKNRSNTKNYNQFLRDISRLIKQYRKRKTVKKEKKKARK
ncbi:MAG: hypothetical protein HYV51_02820 [Parcubacteria group bacterium]|nr:hypothetical protein [Parcubacteria group bacterium]